MKGLLPGNPLSLADESSFQSQFSDRQINQAAEVVMSGNEFRSVRRRVLERIEETDADAGFLKQVMEWTGDLVQTIVQPVFDAIGNFIQWIIRSLNFGRGSQSVGSTPGPAGRDVLGAGFEGLSQLLAILAIVGIVLVLMVIVAMVVKSADRRKKDHRGLLLEGEEDLADLSVPPGELAAATYEGRALQYAANGNYRAAIRELLLGSMSWIERSGLIRYRKGLTNRDYVRAVWKRRDKRDAFAVTALEFERIFFGRRSADQHAFHICLTVFQGAFREEEHPVATV